MPTVRIPDDDSSTGTSIATVLLGAAAGFAVGIYVAQRMGGFAGIVGRLTRPTKDHAPSYYEAVGEDFLNEEPENEDEDEEEEDVDEDEDELEIEEELEYEDEDLDDVPAAKADDADAPILEERVLEAFNNDPVLAERAIDIGAMGAGEIELEGWVDDDREAEHAVTIARGVPGVRSVANRLMVDAE